MGASKGRPLHVALLLRSCLVPAWAIEVANALSRSDRFQVRALVLSPEPHGRAGAGLRPADLRSRLADLVNAHATRKARQAHPFELVDIERALPGLPVTVVDDDSAVLAGSDIDVAVAVDPGIANHGGALHGVAPRLGTWFSPALDEPRDGGLAMLFEAPEAHHSPHVVTVLSSGGGPGVRSLIDTAEARRESMLVVKNRDEAAWGAASLVLAALERASGSDGASCLAGGRTASTCAGQASSGDGADALIHSVPPAHPPRPLAAAAHAAIRLARNATRTQEWLLAYHFGEDGTLAPTDATSLIEPPPDRYWADPHVVAADGDHHVFFEEFLHSSGRGRIATMRVHPDGPTGESACGARRPAPPLVPFRLRSRRRVVHDRGVRREPPRRSVSRARLPHGLEQGQDASRRRRRGRHDHDPVRRPVVAVHDDPPAARRLVDLPPLPLSADHPLSDGWEPHPMNPVTSGTCTSRAAGNIFRDGDRLIRPSQDSRSAYGGRIQLNEIVTLTGDVYRERPVGGLEPNTSGGFTGLHTIARCGDMTMVDLCRWRRHLL